MTIVTLSLASQLQGSESHQADLAAAEQCTQRFSQYEDKEPALVLEQGNEPTEFRRAFKLPLQRPPLVPNVIFPFREDAFHFWIRTTHCKRLQSQHDLPLEEAAVCCTGAVSLQ